VVRRWVQNGLLRPVASYANTHYFSQAEVEQFMANHLFTETAAEILQVGKLVVQKWARAGRLKPVSGPDVDGGHRYLFRRDEVERMRPENRLTAPEMAKRLGISRSQLGEWIRQGKIVPISGPGIDGAKHYLFVWQQ